MIKKIMLSCFLFAFTMNVNAAVTCTKADIEKLVKEACSLVQENASTAFGDFLTKDKFKACESYLWVNDAQNQNFMIHHPKPTLLGKAMKCKSSTPPTDGSKEECLRDSKSKKPIFNDCFDLNSKKPNDSGWCQYNWTKNKTSAIDLAIEPKCSFVMNCGIPKAGSKEWAEKFSKTEHVVGFGIYSTCAALSVSKFVDVSK